MPQLSLVIPTYREAENLKVLCEAIEVILLESKISYEIIIADDHSPDGTIEIVESLTRRYPIRLIQPLQRQRDLSLAVLDGIGNAKSEFVVVMDADLSHPVDKIPELLSMLSEGIFVLGSRYIEGASFEKGWGIWRLLNSSIATVLAWPLIQCKDPMSGFFGLCKADLPSAESLNPIGYKIALELMVKGNFDTVIEIPIHFKDRAMGRSKLNLKQQINYLRHLRRLYLFKFRLQTEFIQYGLVGASGFVVDICFYFAMQVLSVDHLLARAISFWPAVSWNWALNRWFTFRERSRRPRAKQWLEFVITSFIGFSINWGVYSWSTTNIDFFADNRLAALIMGILFASVFNFISATFFIYSNVRGSKKLF